ncbi:MAG: hypothetical protein IJD55_04215 [Clostridia bacterium]|nr:hypothetical protein [Clostridia bacterium]
MKKRIIIIICILIALIFLFPIPLKLKDGGTVKYKALLYEVSNVHSLIPLEEYQKGKKFYEGIIIEILGFEVFNNVA